MATKTRSRKATIESTVTRPELLIEGSDWAFRQFVHDTLAFSARLQQVRGQLGQVIGLSGMQYTVLIAIAHLRAVDEKVGVNLVADHLHFSGAFITIEINKLVAAGLVETETDVRTGGDRGSGHSAAGIYHPDRGGTVGKIARWRGVSAEPPAEASDVASIHAFARRTSLAPAPRNASEMMESRASSLAMPDVTMRPVSSR